MKMKKYAPLLCVSALAAALTGSTFSANAAVLTVNFTGIWNSLSVYGGAAPAVGDSFAGTAILDTSLPDTDQSVSRGLYFLTSPLTITTAGHNYSTSDSAQVHSHPAQSWLVLISNGFGGTVDSLPVDSTVSIYIAFTLIGNQADEMILPNLVPSNAVAFLYYNIYNATNPTQLVGGFNIGGAITSFTIVDPSVVDPPLSETPIPAALPLFATVLGGGLIVMRRRRGHACKAA